MEKWNSTGEFSHGKCPLNLLAGSLWFGFLVYGYRELYDFTHVIGYVKTDDQHAVQTNMSVSTNHVLPVIY